MEAGRNVRIADHTDTMMVEVLESASNLRTMSYLVVAPASVNRETHRAWSMRKTKNMKKALFVVSVLILSSLKALSQEEKDRTCHITVPGMTFTRSLNSAATHVRIEQGKLTLTSEGKRDYFHDPDGTFSINSAPILLTQVDNRRPFTFTVKATPSFLATYDAGALYIYVNDDLWLKMGMELDERHKTRMVTVRTIGTSDDNDHELVSSKSVYMKISSDTKKVGFYYSLDNENWQLIRIFRNDYPASIWVGISSQSPSGNGTSSIFEDLSLVDRSVIDFRMGK